MIHSTINISPYKF